MEDGDEEKQLEAEHYAGAYQAAFSQAMRFWAEVDGTSDADAQELADLQRLYGNVLDRNDRLVAELADLRKRNEELEEQVIKLQRRWNKLLSDVRDWQDHRMFRMRERKESNHLADAHEAQVYASAYRTVAERMESLAKDTDA